MEDNVVVINSDSEEDETKISVKSVKLISFKRLWDRANAIVFHHLSSNYKLEFPYVKFKNFYTELKKTLSEITLESTRSFIWQNLIQWLIAMKLSYSGIVDLKFDERFNFILIDFMAEYINYKCKLNIKLNDDYEIQKQINEILDILGIMFNGNSQFIVMTLLKVDVTEEYTNILNPIFNKYLSDKFAHKSKELISYLQLILCYKQWKKLAKCKEDREAINEIAVGKSIKTLNKNCNGKCTDIQESILPKCVPTIDDNNRTFTTISDLIGHAIENGNFGTRILLIKKSLDLDEAIEKYFIQYERYINRFDPTSLCISTNLLSLNDVDNTNKFDNIHKTTKFDENKAKEKMYTSPQKKQQEIFNQQSTLLGKKREQQHLSNVCDINHRLSNIKNNNNRLLDNKLLNYNKNISNRSIVSRKNNNNNQNCDHNIIEDIIEIDTTDNSSEEYDDNINNSTDITKKIYSKKSVPYKKSHQSRSKKNFRNNTTGNLLKNNMNNNSLEKVQTILLLSSSDEDDNKIECTQREKFLNNNSNDSRCSSRNSSISSESEIAQPETPTNKTKHNLIQSPQINNINLNSPSPPVPILPTLQQQRITNNNTNNRFLNSTSTPNTRDRGNATLNIKKLEKQRCIPGEVSSTTLLDFTISDQNDIAIASTSSAVEVHSASGNYETVQNIREVGNIIKVISPSTSQFKNRFGNDNSTVSNKSLTYSDVSSDDDDDTDGFSITHNLYSRIPKKYIREIEKAISSTSEINHAKVNCISSRNFINNANIESSQNENSVNNENITIPKQAERIQFSFTNNTKSNKEPVASKTFNNNSSSSSDNHIDKLNKNEINSLAVIPYAPVSSSLFNISNEIINKLVDKPVKEVLNTSTTINEISTKEIVSNESLNNENNGINSIVLTDKPVKEVLNTNSTTNEISNKEIVNNESLNNENNGINSIVLTKNDETSLCRLTNEVPFDKTEKSSNIIQNSKEKLEENKKIRHMKLNEEINNKNNLSMDNTPVDKTIEESLTTDNNNLDNTKSEEINEKVNEKQICKIDNNLEILNNNKNLSFKISVQNNEKPNDVNSQRVEKNSKEILSGESTNETPIDVMVTENILEKSTPDIMKIDQNLPNLIIPSKVSATFSTNDIAKSKKYSDESLQQPPEKQNSKSSAIKTFITKTHKPLLTYSKQLVQKIISKPNLLTNKNTNITAESEFSGDISDCDPKAITVVKEKHDAQIESEPKSMPVIKDTPSIITEVSAKETIKEEHDTSKKQELLTEIDKLSEVKESINEKIDPLLKTATQLTNNETNYNRSEKPLKTYSKKSTFIRRVHKIFDDKTFFKKYSKHSTTIKIVKQEMKNPQNAKEREMKKPLRTYTNAKVNHIIKKSEDESTKITPELQQPLLEPLNIDLQTENLSEKTKEAINCEINFDIKELTGIVNSPQKFENEKILEFDDNTGDSTVDMDIFNKNLDSENKILGDVQKNSCEINQITKEIEKIVDDKNENILKNIENHEKSPETLCNENALPFSDENVLPFSEKTPNKDIEMVITENDYNSKEVINSEMENTSETSSEYFLLESIENCENMAISKLDNASAEIIIDEEIENKIVEYEINGLSSNNLELVADLSENSIKSLLHSDTDSINDFTREKTNKNAELSNENNIGNEFFNLSSKSTENINNIVIPADKNVKDLEFKSFNDSNIITKTTKIIKDDEQLDNSDKVEPSFSENPEEIVSNITEKDNQIDDSEMLKTDEIEVMVKTIVTTATIYEIDNFENLEKLKSNSGKSTEIIDDMLEKSQPEIVINSTDIAERNDQLDKLESVEKLESNAFDKLTEIVNDDIKNINKYQHQNNSVKLEKLESKKSKEPEITVNSTGIAERDAQFDKSESVEKLESNAFDKLEEVVNKVTKRHDQNVSENLKELESKTIETPKEIENTTDTTKNVNQLTHLEKSVSQKAEEKINYVSEKEKQVMLKKTEDYVTDVSAVMVGATNVTKKDDKLENSTYDLNIVKTGQDNCAEQLLSDKIIEPNEISENTHTKVLKIYTKLKNDNSKNQLKETPPKVLIQTISPIHKTVSRHISNLSKEIIQFSSGKRFKTHNKKNDLHNQKSIVEKSESNNIKQNKITGPVISNNEVSTEILSNNLHIPCKAREQITLNDNYKIVDLKSDTEKLLIAQLKNDNLNNLDKTQNVLNTLSKTNFIATNVEFDKGNVSDVPNNVTPETECQDLIEKPEYEIEFSLHNISSNESIYQENNQGKELCPTNKIQNIETELNKNLLVEPTKSQQPKIILEMFDEILDVPLTRDKKLEQEISNYQNTPFKLRIKRRLSQCANINDMFDSTYLHKDLIETQKLPAEEIPTKSNELDNSTNENEMMTSLLNRIDEILDEKEQNCQINPKIKILSQVVENQIKENFNKEIDLNSDYSLKEENAETISITEENSPETKEVWMKTIGLGKTSSTMFTEDHIDSSDTTYGKICGRRKKSRCIKRLSSLDEIESNNIDSQNCNTESDPFHDVVIPMENFLIQNDNNEKLVRSNFELLLEAAKLVCDKKNENIPCQKVSTKKIGRPKKKSSEKTLPARSTRLSCSALEKEEIENNVRNAFIIPKKSVIRNPNKPINQQKKLVRFLTPGSNEILMPEKTLEFSDSFDYSDVINFVNKKKRKKFTKNNLHIDTKKINNSTNEEENFSTIKNDNKTTSNFTNLNLNDRPVSPTSSNSTDSDDFGKLVIDIPDRIVTKTSPPEIKSNKTKKKKNTLKKFFNIIENDELSAIEKPITQEKFILPPPVINYDDGLLMVTNGTPCQKIYEEVEAELNEQKKKNEKKSEEITEKPKKQTTTSITPNSKLPKPPNKKPNKTKIQTSSNIVHLNSQVDIISICSDDLSENFHSPNRSATQMSAVTISPSKENRFCYGPPDECEIMYPIIELSETDDILNIGGSEYSPTPVKQNQKNNKKFNKKNRKKKIIKLSTKEMEITFDEDDKKHSNILNGLEVINQSGGNIDSTNKKQFNKIISTSRKLSTDSQKSSNKKQDSSEKEINITEIVGKNSTQKRNSKINDLQYSPNQIKKDLKSSINIPKSQNKIKDLKQLKIPYEDNTNGKEENVDHEENEKYFTSLNENAYSVKNLGDLKLKTIQLNYVEEKLVGKSVTENNKKSTNQDEVVNLQSTNRDDSKDVTSQINSLNCKPSKKLKITPPLTTEKNLTNKCEEKRNLKKDNSNLEKSILQKDEKIINKNSILNKIDIKESKLNQNKDIFPVQIIRSCEKEKICKQMDLQVQENNFVSRNDAKVTEPKEFEHSKTSAVTLDELQKPVNDTVKQNLPIKPDTKADLNADKKLAGEKSNVGNDTNKSIVETKPKNRLENNLEQPKKSISRLNQKSQPKLGKDINSISNKLLEIASHEEANLKSNIDKQSSIKVVTNNIENAENDKIVTAAGPNIVEEEKIIEKSAKPISENIKKDKISVEIPSPINREVVIFKQVIKPTKYNLKVQPVALLKVQNILNDTNSTSETILGKIVSSTSNLQQNIINEEKKSTEVKKELKSIQNIDLLNHEKQKLVDITAKNNEKLLNHSIQTSQFNSNDKKITETKSIDTDESKKSIKNVTTVDTTVTDQIINAKDIIPTIVPAKNVKKLSVSLKNDIISTVKPLVKKQLKTTQGKPLSFGKTLNTKSNLRKSKEIIKLSQKSFNIKSCFVNLSPFLHDPVIMQKKNALDKIENIHKLLENTDTNKAKQNTFEEVDIEKILKKKNLVSLSDNENMNTSNKIDVAETVDLLEISKKESINSSEICEENNKIHYQDKEEIKIVETSKTDIVSLEIEPVKNLNLINEKDSLNILQKESHVELNNDSTTITTPKSCDPEKIVEPPNVELNNDSTIITTPKSSDPEKILEPPNTESTTNLEVPLITKSIEKNLPTEIIDSAQKDTFNIISDTEKNSLDCSESIETSHIETGKALQKISSMISQIKEITDIDENLNNDVNVESEIKNCSQNEKEPLQFVSENNKFDNKTNDNIVKESEEEIQPEKIITENDIKITLETKSKSIEFAVTKKPSSNIKTKNYISSELTFCNMPENIFDGGSDNSNSSEYNKITLNLNIPPINEIIDPSEYQLKSELDDELNKRNAMKRKRKYRRLSSNKKTRLQNISNEELRKIAENKKCFIKLTKYRTVEELRRENQCKREESNLQNERSNKRVVDSPNNSPTSISSSPNKSYESDSDTTSVTSNEDIHSTILNVQKQLDDLKDLRFSTNDNVADTSLTEISSMNDVVNTPFKNSVEDISFDTRLASFDFSTPDWCSDTILDSITKDLTGHHEYSANNKGDYMISGKVPENSLGLRGIICPLIDSDITNFVQIESDEIDVNNINTTATSMNQAVNMNLILNESVITSKHQHQQQQEVLKNNLENSDELLNYLGNVNTINPDDFLNPIETNDNYQFRTDVGFDFQVHDNPLYDLDLLIENNSKNLSIDQKSSLVNKSNASSIKNYSICNNNFNSNNIIHSTPKKYDQLQNPKLSNVSSDGLLIDGSIINENDIADNENDPTKKFVKEFIIPEKDLAEASSSKSNSNNFVEQSNVVDGNKTIQEKETTNNNSIEKRKNEEQINTIESVKSTNQQSTFDQLKSDCNISSNKTPIKSENKLKSDAPKEISISNRRKSLAELKLSISDKLANNQKTTEKCQTPRTPESKLKSYPTPSWKMGNMKRDKNQSPPVKEQLSFVEKQSPTVEKQSQPVEKQSPPMEKQTVSVEESKSTTTISSTTSTSSSTTAVLSTTSTIPTQLSSSNSTVTISKDMTTKLATCTIESANLIKISASPAPVPTTPSTITINKTSIENVTTNCTKVNVMTISASPVSTTPSTITSNKTKTVFHMPVLELSTTTNDSFKKVKPLIRSPNVTAIPKNLPQFNAGIIITPNAVKPKVVIDFIPVVKKSDPQIQPIGNNIKRSSTETISSDIPLKRKLIETDTSSPVVDIFDQLKNEPPVNNVQMKLDQCKNEKNISKTVVTLPKNMSSSPIVVTLPKNMSSSLICTTVSYVPIQNSTTKIVSTNINKPTISNVIPSPTTKTQINAPLEKSPIVSSQSGQYPKYEMDKTKSNISKVYNQVSFRNPNVTPNSTSSPTIKSTNSPKITIKTPAETQQIKRDNNTNAQVYHITNKNPAFKNSITKQNTTPSSVTSSIKPPVENPTKNVIKIENQTNKIPVTIIQKPTATIASTTSINEQQKEPILNKIVDIKTAIENLPEPKTYGEHRQRQQLLKQLEEQNLKRKAEMDAKILAEKQQRFDNRYKNHQQQKHYHHHHHKYNSHDPNSINKTKSSGTKREYVNLFSKLSENPSSNIYLSKLALNAQNKNSNSNKMKPLTIPTEWEYRQVSCDELIADLRKQKNN